MFQRGEKRIVKKRSKILRVHSTRGYQLKLESRDGNRKVEPTKLICK